MRHFMLYAVDSINLLDHFKASGAYTFVRLEAFLFFETEILYNEEKRGVENGTTNENSAGRG